LGIYSLAISESLLARFLFFILSAFIVCALVIKISNKLLPDDDRREKKVMKKKDKKPAMLEEQIRDSIPYEDEEVEENEEL